MATVPRFVRALRRRLLEQPGITALPVCPVCARQVPLREMGADACRKCEAEYAEAADYWQAQLDATLSNAPPRPAERMFDSADAAKPFLPEDDA